MTREELIALHKRLNLTQDEMAERIGLGLGLRAYGGIEGGGTLRS